MKISIIIPTCNEEGFIQSLLRYLNGLDAHGLLREIIVVDGSSTDRTVAHAKLAGAIVLSSDIRSRAVQLNLGAEMATGDVYYFLHADSLPPESLFEDLYNTIDAGFEAGCYQLSFDKSHWFLRLNAWFTRFDCEAFRFGDQSLFVTQNAYHKIGGYDQKLTILEDNEIITRLKKKVKFRLLNKKVVTSARKYIACGVFRLQFSYYLLYLFYKLGGTQQFLLKTYRVLLGKSWSSSG
ncbi:TIGR04283 family arsenosugar biosynthesis glycosyltransferase [Fulvivirgaceae bacterium BMA12]|uniref:TIGR04283 family arsenosugar biosynthesis glycosyltransferase n=1 Tax=Agaribacillus aureus TaxID=3051825 RepID=A0ABT8L4M4_9BACT|nr:TIGR04283 family arsenosugar biosynthesis glycosyltransferase [Fulvivirgaceae bacterium BMA12]